MCRRCTFHGSVCVCVAPLPSAPRKSFWWIEWGRAQCTQDREERKRKTSRGIRWHSAIETLKRRHDGFIESKHFIRQDKFISANDIQQSELFPFANAYVSRARVCRLSHAANARHNEIAVLHSFSLLFELRVIHIFAYILAFWRVRTCSVSHCQRNCFTTGLDAPQIEHNQRRYFISYICMHRASDTHLRLHTSQKKVEICCWLLAFI